MTFKMYSLIFWSIFSSLLCLNCIYVGFTGGDHGPGNIWLVENVLKLMKANRLVWAIVKKHTHGLQE